jgi:hypothetical protein
LDYLAACAQGEDQGCSIETDIQTRRQYYSLAATNKIDKIDKDPHYYSLAATSDPVLKREKEDGVT